jgi:hypothetical protein
MAGREHLYRRHRLSRDPEDGFNETQEVQLKVRQRNQPVESKWRAVYQILFPCVKAEEVPSPCE